MNSAPNLQANSQESQLNSKIDLAGYCDLNPHYFQVRARINFLVERYLSLDILSAQLQDLPQQFVTPQPRAWQKIDWKALDIQQIVGINPKFFVAVIAAIVEVETPIRNYSQESWNYFKNMHAPMAQFMGSNCSSEVSIWEKEERQHAPVFGKIYQHLTGEKLQPKPNSVQNHVNESPINEIYKHTISRISTEWGAASVYLWLMAHSTGELQKIIAQPLQDEIGHLAKFWGFAIWAFKDSLGAKPGSMIGGAVGQLTNLFGHHRGERTNSNDILQQYKLTHTVELAFTFTRVMAQLYRWSCNLRPDYLEMLLGKFDSGFSSEFSSGYS